MPNIDNILNTDFHHTAEMDKEQLLEQITHLNSIRQYLFDAHSIGIETFFDISNALKNNYDGLQERLVDIKGLSSREHAIKNSHVHNDYSFLISGVYEGLIQSVDEIANTGESSVLLVAHSKVFSLLQTIFANLEEVSFLMVTLDNKEPCKI